MSLAPKIKSINPFIPPASDCTIPPIPARPKNANILAPNIGKVPAIFNKLPASTLENAPKPSAKLTNKSLSFGPPPNKLIMAAAPLNPTKNAPIPTPIAPIPSAAGPANPVAPKIAPAANKEPNAIKLPSLNAPRPSAKSVNMVLMPPLPPIASTRAAAPPNAVKNAPMPKPTAVIPRTAPLAPPGTIPNNALPANKEPNAIKLPSLNAPRPSAKSVNIVLIPPLPPIASMARAAPPNAVKNPAIPTPTTAILSPFVPPPNSILPANNAPSATKLPPLNAPRPSAKLVNTSFNPDIPPSLSIAQAAPPSAVKNAARPRPRPPSLDAIPMPLLKPPNAPLNAPPRPKRPSDFPVSPVFVGAVLLATLLSFLNFDLYSLSLSPACLKNMSALFVGFPLFNLTS